jgi:hypothetical protein
MQVEGDSGGLPSDETGARVSNTYVICLQEGDNFGKPELIPHNAAGPHGHSC